MILASVMCTAVTGVATVLGVVAFLIGTRPRDFWTAAGCGVIALVGCGLLIHLARLP